ncbi:MAG: tetratricopeptide repeat protein [Treponemataceae bacterium]|nr:tetratricopeptide repeat protein [Treponemataceae bacterium]
MEKEEKKTISSRLNAWLTKYRFILLCVIGLLIVASVVFAVIYMVDNNNKKTGFNALDDLQYQYVNLKNETNPAEETDEQKAKVQEILIQVKNLADENSGNPVGSRSYMFEAEIEYGTGDYAAAKDSWLKAVSANEKAYTTPLCWFNASVCCENLGDVDGAVELLLKALERKDFSMKARALYSLGRIEDQREDYAKAAEYYTRLSDEYGDQTLGQVAKSRLIMFETEGLIQ